jgi:hypothetical protein
MYQNGRFGLAMAMCAALSMGLSLRPDYDVLREMGDDLPPMPRTPKKQTHRGHFTPSPMVRSQPKSSSLERLLKKAKAR